LISKLNVNCIVTVHIERTIGYWTSMHLVGLCCVC